MVNRDVKRSIPGVDNIARRDQLHISICAIHISSARPIKYSHWKYSQHSSHRTPNLIRPIAVVERLGQSLLILIGSKLLTRAIHKDWPYFLTKNTTPSCCDCDARNFERPIVGAMMMMCPRSIIAWLMSLGGRHVLRLFSKFIQLICIIANIFDATARP